MYTKVYLNVQHIKVESKRILEHFTMLILVNINSVCVSEYRMPSKALGKKKALE